MAGVPTAGVSLRQVVEQIQLLLPPNAQVKVTIEAPGHPTGRC